MARAAELLGVSQRSVRRQCQLGALPARRVAGPDGPMWMIPTTARPEFRLAGGCPNSNNIDTPTLSTSWLAGVPAAHRAEILRRREIVEGFLGDRRHRPAGMNATAFTRAWCAAWNRRHPDERPISRTTLLVWRRRYRRRGLAGLLDGRANNRDRRGVGTRGWTVEAREFFEGMYLSRNAFTVTGIYELMDGLARERGWAIPSLRTCHTHARSLSPALATLGREGAEQHRNRQVPHISRDWQKVPAGYCWVGDHRRLDVLLPRRVTPAAGPARWAWRRPWLTMYLDARSWLPVAWSISFDAPDGNRTMATFAAGIRDHGAPAACYIDNGKDFRMRRFSGGRGGRVPDAHADAVRSLLGAIDVDVTFALRFNARAKVVEPFFRLLADRFDRTWETYCGRSSDERPEHCKTLRGRAQEYHAAGLTLEALSAAFDAWVTADYALRKSPATAAEGLSAARAFAELRGKFEARRIDERTLALLLLPSRAVTVTPQGVRCRPHGRHYWSEELADRRGRSGRDKRSRVRYRYDPDDDSRIWVFDAETDRFLCIAEPAPWEGLNPLAEPGTPDAETVVAAIVAQRRQQQVDRAAVAGKRRAAVNIILEATRRAAELSGRLDDPASIAMPAANVVRFTGGEIERAADAGRKHEQKLRREQAVRRRPTAAEFFAATGTTGEPADGDRRPPTALELLARQQQEPDHDAGTDSSADAHEGG